MKIGIVLHPYGEKMPGGLHRVIFGWVEALIKYAPENEYVIFLKNPISSKPDLPKGNWRVEVLGGYPIFWLNRLKKYPAADVYIFNTPVMPPLFKPRKSVLIVYDFPYKYLKPKNILDFLRRILISRYHKLSLRRAQSIVTVSDATKEDVVKLFGIGRDKIKTIYHGFKRICSFPEKEVVLPEKFFFFSGTIKERKNIFRIIKAYEAFKRENPEAPQKLVIVGKIGGAYYEKLADYVFKAGLFKDVLFLGYFKDPELAYIYKRAEALIFPSLIEGSGNPILEAMDCGTPVITSNISGTKELGSGAAILINPYDSNEIKKAMEEIVKNPELRRSLKERGLERVKIFSWQSAVFNLLDLIKKLK